MCSRGPRGPHPVDMSTVFLLLAALLFFANPSGWSRIQAFALVQFRSLRPVPAARVPQSPAGPSAFHRRTIAVSAPARPLVAAVAGAFALVAIAVLGAEHTARVDATLVLSSAIHAMTIASSCTESTRRAPSASRAAARVTTMVGRTDRSKDRQRIHRIRPRCPDGGGGGVGPVENSALRDARFATGFSSSRPQWALRRSSVHPRCRRSWAPALPRPRCPARLRAVCPRPTCHPHRQLSFRLARRSSRWLGRCCSSPSWPS